MPYATATVGVTAMSTASPCMKPKNVSTAPASAKAEALTNFLSMEVATHVDDDQHRPIDLDGQRRRFSVEDPAWHATHSCLALTREIRKIWAGGV
jgi:hypothetical protein